MNPGREFDADAAAAGIRFVTQGLSHEEIAAVTAVLTAALASEQAAASASAALTPSAESEWARAARGLRQPLRGGWRGFTAEGL